MSSSSFTSSSEGTSDPRALASFLGRAVWFAVPLLIYMGLVVAADPFRLFEVSHLFPDSLKNKTARPINPCLWKLVYFDKHPAADIMLGDSRTENLTEKLVTEQTGLHYANLAYGGATLNEIIDTFWFAANRVPLKNVVIGINLNVYNGYAIYRRTAAVESFFSNRLLYFTNRNIAEAVYQTYRASLTGTVPELETVDAKQEDFWNEVIRAEDIEFRRWADPGDYRHQLKKISDWCRQHGTTLTFVVFPTHQDVHDVIERYRLTEQQAAMKKDLAGWGRLVDFDLDTTITNDRSRFRDPVHVTRETNIYLIPKIFANAN